MDMGELSGLHPLSFFTTDSNLLMGLISLILVIMYALLWTKKINKIYRYFFVLELLGVVGVVLTFLTVVFFLAPVVSKKGEAYKLFISSNIFYHVAVPLVSAINFILFSNGKEFKFKQTFFGMIPMRIYAIAYMIVCLTHIQNGQIVKPYDWYGFCKFGLHFIPLALIIMLGVTYLICFLLWILNQKICLFEPKKENSAQENK